MIRRAVLAAAAAVLLSTSVTAAAGKTVSIFSYGFTPNAPIVAAGALVTWRNIANINHNVTPNVPAVTPFNAVTIIPDHGFSDQMTQAGTFKYHCAIHPTRMKGSIRVKMSSSPTSGTTATIFTIRVGSADSAPGFEQQIQRRKGAGSFLPWINVASQTVTWDPNSNDHGTWGFRTRYRQTSTGDHSSWSPTLSITVN